MADNQKPVAEVANNGERKPSAVKADFDLHVLLIMKQEALPKPKALMRAWLEGPAGLNVRLQK